MPDAKDRGQGGVFRWMHCERSRFALGKRIVTYLGYNNAPSGIIKGVVTGDLLGMGVCAESKDFEMPLSGNRGRDLPFSA